MFRKKVSPAEKAKEWKKSIKTQARQLERQLTKITREEDRLKLRVKTLIKQGNADAAMPLVKELVTSKKAKSRLLTTKLQLDSVVREIDLQLAHVKVCGAFQASTEVTKILNRLVSLPDMQMTLGTLQQEMEQAGMTAEMVDDAMDMVQDDELTEDPEVGLKLVFNEIATEINATAAKPIPLMEIDPEELPEEQRAAVSA